MGAQNSTVSPEEKTTGDTTVKPSDLKKGESPFGKKATQTTQVDLPGVVPGGTQASAPEAEEDVECCPEEAKNDPVGYFTKEVQENTRFRFLVAGSVVFVLMLLIIIVVAATSGGDDDTSTASAAAIAFGLDSAVQLSGVTAAQFNAAAQTAFKSVVGTKMGVSASAVQIQSVTRRTGCTVDFKIVLTSAPTATQRSTLSSYLTSTSSSGLKQQLNADSAFAAAPVSSVTITQAVTLITPAPTPAPTLSCQPIGSVGQCGQCLKGEQCGKSADGTQMYCCPYMKKCVPSSSTPCSYPIANCQPMCYDSKVGTSQCTCQAEAWNQNRWAPPTCGTATPSPTPAPGTATQSPTAAPVSALDSDRWLEQHNLYRCMHDSPDLVWSTAMGNDAANYADSLGTTMVHSDSYNFAPPLGPAGENLAYGHFASTAAGGIENVVSAWYSEVDDCASLPGCTTPSSTSKQVGHFTALIWKGATTLGCGYSNARMYVCRYKAGDTKSSDTPNMAGSYTQNVVAATKTEAQCHRRRAARL